MATFGGVLVLLLRLALLAALVAVSVCQTNGDPASTGVAPASCSGAGEEPQDCGPACGDRTCNNQSRNDVLCTRQCKAGCFCKGGYVRNGRNLCIPAYMCGTSG